uniref:Predicted protein n=1 Tax=Hordeum vulgare subsp. vulgare TaxID=112509 RepID=F2ECE6_HORVV|nr:predicted protein [Hordeum vulgare subsp. vulgare]
MLEVGLYSTTSHDAATAWPGPRGARGCGVHNGVLRCQTRYGPLAGSTSGEVDDSCVVLAPCCSESVCVDGFPGRRCFRSPHSFDGMGVRRKIDDVACADVALLF